ncbi:MAG: potassium-transporting ATPase subunit KdpC [Turneriella sp.]
MKLQDILIATRLLLVLSLICGGLYPLLVTGIAQAAFADKANGSIVQNGKGEPVGSSLIAQRFSGEGYFWARPSAGDFGTVPSGASNKGPTSADLKKAVDDRRAALKATANLAKTEIPAELLFASGSGLDPHIGKAAALFQVERIARVRKMDAAKRAALAALVERQTESPQWGFLGDERVNVLLLNLALDKL